MSTVLIPFALAFIYIVFFAGPKVCCLNCNTPLPRLRSPFSMISLRWWEGGAICKACGRECDRQGNPTATSPPVRLGTDVMVLA